MKDTNEITLNTTLKKLKCYSVMKRNTIFLLKEFGAANVADILAVDLLAFLDVKGVGKKTYCDLRQFQKKFSHLKQLSIGHSGEGIGLSCVEPELSTETYLSQTQNMKKLGRIKSWYIDTDDNRLTSTSHNILFIVADKYYWVRHDSVESDGYDFHVETGSFELLGETYNARFPDICGRTNDANI